VVRELAKAGYRVRVVARDPEKALHLKTSGEVGQIALVKGNLALPDSLTGLVDGSYAVINLVGILFESGKQNFGAIHAQGAERLAKLARQAGATRFIQVSAIGTDKALKSKYARTKALGEKAVMAAFPEATILRPSIIFGPEDQFYNRFASIARFTPALPLIGGGHTLFQPVYAGDVAKAICAVLAQEETRGRTYELGGPQSYSIHEILSYILNVTGNKRALVNFPFSLASLISLFTEILPNPPLTRDQVNLLHYDNVVTPGARTINDLGITPTAVEMVVPNYLARYRK
jgi:NADH dehydrogenase